MEGVGWLRRDHHRRPRRLDRRADDRQTSIGLIANIILGIVGALVLNAILVRRRIGYTYDGWIGQLIVGAIGAIILIFLYRVVTRPNPQ